MIEYGVGIIGVNHYLPEMIQTNEELCEQIEELTPEWILEKTGIKRRYHISGNETASSMALNVSKKLLKEKKIKATDIGLIIVASFSQDYLFPPLSAKIHNSIGATKNCQIIDINTNCVGLVTGLTIAAERMLSNSNINYSLIIGVEVLSTFTNKKDKETAIYFSDGASAILLGKTPKGYGYLNSAFATDSSNYESVRMRGGGSVYPVNKENIEKKAKFIEQNGLATWKQAITNLPFVLKKLKIPRDNTYTNVEEIGNTGSASIGIALSEALSKGLIHSNDLLILTGVGAGYNFGANLWKMQ